MRIKAVQLGQLYVNCYILDNAGRALAIDPGGEPASALEYLAAEGLKLERILVTHLHFDHISGCAALAKATGAPIFAPQADAFLMDTELGGGDSAMWEVPPVPPFSYEPAPLGETEFIGLPCRCLATPGHSPGSLTYYFPTAKAAFVGDLVFYRSCGRTDFVGGDQEALRRSVLEVLFALPDDTAVYPGHGIATSVGEEKLHNPQFMNATA